MNRRISVTVSEAFYAEIEDFAYEIGDLKVQDVIKLAVREYIASELHVTIPVDIESDMAEYAHAHGLDLAAFLSFAARNYMSRNKR